ncbi:hypothetical protein F5888DRAFT_368213 [Russula emetica]|nr:hypothetical protein F5888DRAFT_368213 [Russula emetica]
MICSPASDANPTLIFPFLSVGMEGGIHYPYLNSRQAVPQVQGLSVSCKGWTNSCLPDRSAFSRKFQVGEKTNSTVSRLDAPMRSIPICGHRQGAGILHPENFSPPSTLLGFECLPDEDKTLADENLTHCSQQTSASKMVPSDQSHRSTPVGATPNVSITSAIPLSGVVQRASRDTSHQSKRMSEKRAEESSRSSRQPAGMHKALKRPYICHHDTCGKTYAQPGGVMRHYRAKHNPNSCTYCGARWSRPYQYRDHLEKHHRDIDPDLVLGKIAGSRRRAKVIGRGRPQNVSPHVVKHDRQSQDAPRCPPSMPPLPAVVKVPQVPLTFSFTEELAQPVNDVVDHSSRLPRALQGGFTTANYLSRPVTTHIPFLCPPVGGDYGDPVSADPVFEPFGFIHPYY